MDRRTVTKRLKGIEPAGIEAGHPVWRLGEAVRAIFAMPGAGEAEALRHRLLAAQTEKAETELEQLKGELVRRGEVEAEAFRHGRAERDALTAWASRIGPVVAAELAVDAARLTTLLSQEVRQYLEERADAASG